MTSASCCASSGGSAPSRSRVEMMSTPGATMVGSLRYVQLLPSGIVNVPVSPRLPREENDVSTASFSPAPTEITHGACAYGLCVSSPGPSLPAAKMLTMPRLYSSYVAMLTGLSGSNGPFVPHELLVTRIGCSYENWLIAA